jgi:hypothetical protein
MKVNKKMNLILFPKVESESTYLGNTFSLFMRNAPVMTALSKEKAD